MQIGFIYLFIFSFFFWISLFALYASFCHPFLMQQSQYSFCFRSKFYVQSSCRLQFDGCKCCHSTRSDRARQKNKFNDRARVEGKKKKNERLLDVLRNKEMNSKLLIHNSKREPKEERNDLLKGCVKFDLLRFSAINRIDISSYYWVFIVFDCFDCSHFVCYCSSDNLIRHQNIVVSFENDFWWKWNRFLRLSWEVQFPILSGFVSIHFYYWIHNSFDVFYFGCLNRVILIRFVTSSSSYFDLVILCTKNCREPRN